MKKLTTLLVLGVAALGLSAGDAERPFYGRVGGMLSQGDLRDYLGGKAYGYGYEVGYDWTNPEDLIGLSLYGGYVRWNGDPNDFLDTVQNLRGWRAGIDLRFNTPLKDVTPYAGIGMTFFNGDRTKASSVLGLPAGYYGDSKAKFGIRVGFEYRLNEAWGLAFDYNAYEWRSNIDASAYKIKGYNPVHPSWVGMSIQYKFNWGN